MTHSVVHDADLQELVRRTCVGHFATFYLHFHSASWQQI